MCCTVDFSQSFFKLEVEVEFSLKFRGRMLVNNSDFKHTEGPKCYNQKLKLNFFGYGNSMKFVF